MLECPEFESLQALVNLEITPDLEDVFSRHVRSCAQCEARLNAIAPADDRLLQTARALGDPTVVPINPALARVMRRLREADGPNRPDEPELHFLRPGPAGSIGTLDEYEVREVIGS